MPCILKVKIVEARDLPIMDRSSALADAYVEIRCGSNETQKTDIQKKTLNPIWNQDFRFDFLNDLEIQDKPLDIRVWDYDLVSKNDMIGSVLIDLNGLLDGETPTSQLSGWFPIYDTLRGIRGELSVVVKLEKFKNDNPFKESSDGIQFFSSSTPFSNYRINTIHSFVEELIVENDPEYHWTDTFRASRLSNFERQFLLYTLSGKLRRQMGKKVVDMGGNAVLGYKQHFDLEGDSGIVARGYGTAVTLRKVTEADLVYSPKHFSSNESSIDSSSDSSSSDSSSDSSSSDSKNSYDLSSSSSSSSSTNSIVNKTRRKRRDKILTLHADVQLLTLQSFQSNVVVHIGGVVATKSVKILKKSNTQDVRDQYWTEIRNEIKSHAKSLGCNYIIGYSETTTIQQDEDLCIFSATGTAAILDLLDKSDTIQMGTSGGIYDSKKSLLAFGNKRRKARSGCNICHIPFKQSEESNTVKCAVCRKKYVPEVLLATIEPPPGIPITGVGSLIQARACKLKKKSQGEESSAFQLSETIPFVEYDLHNQIMYKLKLLGMNAAFNLKTQITFSDTLVIGIATATAVFLTPLPSPPILKISRNLEITDDKSRRIHDLQAKIERKSLHNHNKNATSSNIPIPSSQLLSTPNSNKTVIKRHQNHQHQQLDTSSGESDIFTQYQPDNINELSTAYILEIDDNLDEDKMKTLIDFEILDGFSLCNSDTLPGQTKPTTNVQLITAIRRVEFDVVDPNSVNTQLSNIFNSLYESVMYKLRELSPCCISGINMDIEIPEDDQIQFVLTAMCTIQMDDVETSFISTPLMDNNPGSVNPLLPPPMNLSSNKFVGNTLPPLNSINELSSNVAPIALKQPPPTLPSQSQLQPPQTQNQQLSPSAIPADLQFDMSPPKSPMKKTTDSINSFFGNKQGYVELTPLFHLPGGRLEKYLGRISIHLIKETFSVKDQGGLGVFSHVFLREANAIVRSHVLAMGGNALIGYHIDEFNLILENGPKGQAYSLISISGDAYNSKNQLFNNINNNSNNNIKISHHNSGHHNLNYYHNNH
ncbi:hypothetical protein DICPUDRAFT_30730 [Dictyostelium purpureum]|uniref:C2 domain-containing protein n=1 Tax=Dictyostelium purpureum TaxID=5786 RepID=F0ZFV3_DICPU|nr:uncharacterized protein DICPUDRAFT_30730 [Dictyostelium purpureum]EGC37159.1 hypothetical protein DICPUDRAFT_30730 [Dictyostelium purpureum]|eukprot:XP_003286287.1 hypothetical protein DICPUDRAFT_30730 [Dictyostelium purpureum]